MPYVIPDFISGKRTDDPEPQRATVVTREEADAFFGTTPADRAGHLRGCAALGLLVHDRDRLTKRVRVAGTTPSGHPRHERAYVFNCEVEAIPRKRRARRPRERVFTW